MEELQEYKDVEDEADRKLAFEKFIERQKVSASVCVCRIQ